MKNILLLLVLFASQLCIAQNKNPSVFHRLLIYNSDNEIMLVKFKDTDIWVTPGFYQDSVQLIKEGLYDIAATYGIKISNPELKGGFSIKREIGTKSEIRIRNIYKCNYLEGNVHFPPKSVLHYRRNKMAPNR